MLGQGGGRLPKCSKTNYVASPPNHLFSLILFKAVACSYTLSTDKQNPLRRECTFKIEIVLEIGMAGVNIY